MPLEPLEIAVLEKLLAGEHPLLSGLERQIAGLSVESRKYTGTGFYTEFLNTGDACPGLMHIDRLKFGDVEAEIDGLSYGAGFLLYVENGLIRMLEGYSYEELWPKAIGQFRIKYSDDSREKLLRDLEMAGR